MADAADLVSLKALGAVVERPGVVVVDVGAGESTSLGVTLTVRNRSLTYVPVDIRSFAVDAQRRCGFDGRVGSATDLPLAEGAVDVIHARFVFGWLDLAGRHRAVEEIVRVGRGAARAVLIDYDWGSAAGPDVLVAWKEKFLELLAGFGFDPFFGQRLASDVRRHLSAAGVDAAAFSVAAARSVATEPMRRALGTIGVLVAAVVDRLTALGLDGDADQLSGLYAAVADHGRRHPETLVTFPAMVATTVDLTDQVAVAAAATAISRRRRARRRADTTKALPPGGPGELGVYRLESEQLIGQARRLQAASYIHHGHHTEESIDADGFLIGSIDPPDVVARSTYLGVLDDDGLVAGCVRMIRPAGGDPATLPTLRKLAARCGSNDAGLTGLPFPPGSVIFEVSGLAKSCRTQDRAVTTRLLLAVVSEARRCGDDYGVMGVVATTAKLLIAVYGQQAIRPLDGTIGTITVAGTGIRPGGVTLIPCYAQTTTFVGDCLQHCQARPDRELSRLNQPLIELTAAAFARSDDR
jgi:ubiquinone/menaquinone biosynthesis C-methylase UbiE